ncbi:MAG: IPT/TIG domain-containing protein, partial [Candidatus Kapabacteria bacterium]|nr:IPT/TIG domain-containing protein [Candidatus Kapabacteria bacterium]
SGNGNAGVWFAATEKGVYRSSNDGRSWSLVNIDRTADNNEVRGITTDGNTIIVNLWKEGLWRSTNNGNSWTKLSIAGETALCRTVYAQQGTNATVWLVGSLAGNIWRSVNSGTSWTRVYQGASAARSIAASSLTQAGIDAFTGTGSIMFASTPGGIAYSRSYGQTWRHTRTTTPQAVSMTMLGNQIFVGFENSPASGASKGTTALTSDNNGTGAYVGFCAPELDYSGCSQGGGGGTGTIIPGSPTITNITPNPATQTNTPVSITITGSGFNGAQVEISSAPGAWQKIAPPFTSQSSTQLVLNVPALLANVVETYRIRVYNGNEIEPSPETPISNEAFWTVLPPAPTLNPVTTSPASVLVGQAATMTLTGANFAANANVRLYGAENSVTTLTPQRPNTANLLTVTLPTFFATGTYQVDVVNPGNPTASGKQPFTVSNPQATITTESTTPLQAVVNQSVQVAYGGSGFLAGVTSVSVIGPSGAVSVTPSISASSINFSFTPTVGGTYIVTVQNPGTTAVVKNVTVLTPPPAPTLGSLSTTVLDAGSPQQTITLTGTNFQPNSKVLVGSDSTTVTTQYISSTQLSATIPALKFAQPNITLNISVATPPFYGLTVGQSSSLPLYVIYPQPTLTNISPNALAARSIPFGTEQPLTFTGSGFYPGTQILWDFGNASNLSTLPFSGTVNNNVGTATLNLGAAYFSTPRVVKVVISNPGYQPQNGPVFSARTTTPLDFTINTIKPILTSVSPRQIVWNGTPFDQIVTASGTNFFSSSRLIVVNDNERELAP